jgi:hypothetical protein
LALQQASSRLRPAALETKRLPSNTQLPQHITTPRQRATAHPSIMPYAKLVRKTGLAHLAGQRLHRVRRRVPARELLGALQERGQAMRAVHAADELGCPMRADLELLVDVAGNGRLSRTVVEQATRKAEARIASDEVVDKFVLVDRRVTHGAVLRSE